LLYTSFVYSQQIPDKPYLFKRFEIGGNNQDRFGEWGFNLAMDMRSLPKSQLIIRLCSTKSLPVAIGSAALDPLIFSDYLSKDFEGFKPTIAFNRIKIDRSEKCIGKVASNTAADLWLVFNDGNLPDSSETIEACQIRIKDIKSKEDKKRDIFVGTYNHRLAIKRLIEELKENPQATGSVIGSYIDISTKEIKQKLSVARTMLKKSGLPANRYDVRLMRWTGFHEIEEPKYLEIKTIAIVKECADLTEARKTIFVD
jgi:hypothetical protein